MYMYKGKISRHPQDPWAGDPFSHTALGIRLEVLIYCPLFLFLSNRNPNPEYMVCGEITELRQK